jgi:hypothetical protein
MSILLQVKMNGPKHSYGSVNKCGDTMASSAWVAARDVDFLNKNLIWVQKNYNNSWKKYHFVVPYGRVFRGKEKALDIIYFELVTTSMSETTNILDKYVDRYVCIVNYHLVMIVACCLSNVGQNMD